MDLISHLRRLFAYDEWANRQALAAMQTAGTPSARALQLFGHLLAAEGMWLSRLQGEPAPLPVWPEMTLALGAEQLDKLHQSWQACLAALTAERLETTIHYTNTQGQTWSNTVADVLMHVAMHSAYHRAQIASELRAHGHTPAQTDFIHAARSGYITPGA